MDIIKVPTKIENPIYTAEFNYSPLGFDVAKSIDKDFDKNKNVEIQQRLAGTIMEVGEPQFWNLKKLCIRKKVRIPVEIDMLLDKFDFWLIQTAFSFMPAPDSQFRWARIVAKLDALSGTIDIPITYDAFPRNIYQKKDVRKELNIGLNFKFQPIIESKVDYIQKIELTKLEPVISVAGIGKSKPTWDFRDKAAFCMQDVNALYMILKMPTVSEGIKISFFSHAEISTKWGGVFPTKSKPKGEESYILNFSTS